MKVHKEQITSAATKRYQLYFAGKNIKAGKRKKSGRITRHNKKAHK